MSNLLSTFLAAKCLFCERIGERICVDCFGHVGGNPRLVYRNSLVGFAATDYSDDAKRLIRSFKELGESELASAIAFAMAPLLRCFTNGTAVLVPVPSNRDSYYERGFNPAELLARELQRLHPSYGFQSLLQKTRKTLDQSKLGPVQRRENLHKSMLAKVGNSDVIIVDDIVTTGATMASAAEALTMGGHKVIGFLTFAETEAK